MVETQVGSISHYFAKIGVAVVKLSGELKVGDKIAIARRDGTRFEQAVASMQIEKAPVMSAGKGTAVGMKVAERVHEGDAVLRIS